MKKMALLLGLFFLVLGGLGLVPDLAPNGNLFGLFKVNLAHNLLHLISGLFGVIVAGTSFHASMVYLRIVGIVYAILAFIGFFIGNAPLLGMFAHNLADAWLHLGIALVGLSFGYAWKINTHINGVAPSERL